MRSRQEITRTVPLLDYEVQRSGDGRTVIAYAAVFDQPYEVSDQYGHYDEIINRAAFNKALARPGALANVKVLFNHGMTLFFTPSERFALPIGTAEEITPDSRGLLTRTRYARTPLGDEVLELWSSGAITGQSFRGPIYADVERAKSGANGRPVIERMQLGLREYGPTPNPVNVDAGLVAIRSQLLAQVDEMTPEERRELASLINTPDPLAVPDDGPAPEAPAESPDPGLSVLQSLAALNANRRRR